MGGLWLGQSTINRLFSTPPCVSTFTCSATIRYEGKEICIERVLVDSGASSCFIDEVFAKENNLKTVNKREPAKVELVDGTILSSGLVTRETTELHLEIGSHQEYLVFSVIKSPAYPIILGMSWLTFHNPRVDWRERRLNFVCGCSIGMETQDETQALAPFSHSLSNTAEKRSTTQNTDEFARGNKRTTSSNRIIDDKGAYTLQQARPIAVAKQRLDSPPKIPARKLLPKVDPPRPNVTKRGYRAPSSSSSTPEELPEDEPFSCSDITKESVDYTDNGQGNQETPEITEDPIPEPQGCAPEVGPLKEPDLEQVILAKDTWKNELPPIPVARALTPLPDLPQDKDLPGHFEDSSDAEGNKGDTSCTIANLENSDLYPPEDSKDDESTTLPAKYAEFVDLFSKKAAAILPEHRKYDCSIDLQEGAQPPFGPIYSLSRPELLALRNYIDENLASGFIQHSKSPAGAPILFVKKKDGTLRLCVDYRGLNKVTVRNRYPLPLIPQLLEQLSRAKVFTKIDLRGAYNLVRIKPGDEWKTAFRTRYGHFEYRVMPFGLTNAPAIFQHMMHDIFREYLDLFVVIYLDDVLVYSNNLKEHEKHVKMVLQKLRDVNLYAKLEKCHFDCDTVEFLGYNVSPSGISMDCSKVGSIRDWQIPKSVKGVQCFLGFANFYRSFIKDYSRIATPLITLTKKDKRFEWTREANNAFIELKQAFTSAPVLAHADPNKPFIMETDGSDFAVGAVLSQQGLDGILHPVAFYSRKLSPAEINYEIYDKELLAIVAAFEHWRNYLYGAAHPVKVYTDHRNLLYYTTTRKLNRRQARWSIFLAEFDFVITFRPGNKQGKPDALSRRPEYALKGDEVAVTQQSAVVLKPRMLKLNTTLSYPAPQDTNILSLIRKSQEKDEKIVEISRNLRIGQARDDEHKDYALNEEGLVTRKGALYVGGVPAKLAIMQKYHDSPAAGHFGVKKTMELVARTYWWPHQRQFIRDYVRSCDTCCRAKPSRHRPYGLLRPLDIPEGPWQSVTMDFITALPMSKGNDSVLVVVDRYSKMAHFVPCRKSINAEETARLLLDQVVKLHGVPKEIITDRGPQFISSFWKTLFELLGSKVKLSSAFHPETDGQTERTNQILEQYLRCTINYQQDNWTELLPLAEFAYNNSVQSATNKTPFYLNCGFHPRLDPRQETFAKNPAALDRIEGLQRTRLELKEQLTKAQNRYKQYADRFRLSSPEFKRGDKVWLLRKHIHTTRPSDKLDYRKLGPFIISEEINPVAFKLKLPDSMRVHDVFHVSLLEKYHPSEIPGRKIPQPPPVQVENETEYEVREILDCKFRGKRLFYLVDWEGFDASERTWEPEENLKNCKEIVAVFHARYPHKPAPRGREKNQEEV